MCALSLSRRETNFSTTSLAISWRNILLADVAVAVVVLSLSVVGLGGHLAETRNFFQVFQAEEASSCPPSSLRSLEQPIPLNGVVR